MPRKSLIWLTDKLTDLFLVTGLDRLAAIVWDWNYELTEPEREQQIKDFVRRALSRED